MPAAAGRPAGPCPYYGQMRRIPAAWGHDWLTLPGPELTLQPRYGIEVRDKYIRQDAAVR